MQDAIRVLAGECTVTFEGTETREERGEVVTVVKPDNTVLVHDADGYQPAAWLTRADVVRYARDTDGFRIVAGKGGQQLVVESHAEHGDAHYPASPAGPAVGECPTCGGTLVRATSGVTCVGCRATYTIPSDATVLEDTCDDCGLPTFRVERGYAVEVCLDPSCRTIADAVRTAIDEHDDTTRWTCECGGALRVERRRGLRTICEACGDVYGLPNGVLADQCDCGRPTFRTANGERCLASDCPAG
jgi:DNA topoisomerase-1